MNEGVLCECRKISRKPNRERVNEKCLKRNQTNQRTKNKHTIQAIQCTYTEQCVYTHRRASEFLYFDYLAQNRDVWEVIPLELRGYKR